MQGLNVILIRHAEPKDIVPGTFLGRTDPGLGREGHQQSQRLGGFLRERFDHIDRWYCSPLKRAQETALALGYPQPMRLRTDARLREIDFGDWDGLSPADIETTHPGAVEAWYRDPYRKRAPEGECLGDVSLRVSRFWAEVHRDMTSGTIAVVAHFGSLCVLASHLLGLRLRQSDRLILQRGCCALIQDGYLRFWNLPESPLSDA